MRTYLKKLGGDPKGGYTQSNQIIGQGLGHAQEEVN